MSRKEDNEKDDLIGFRDFIDGEDVKPSRVIESKQFRGFDLITFLEQESTRLSQQIDLFEEKVFMLKKYPQDSALFAEEEERNFELQSQVIQKIKQEDSIFFKNLDHLLKEHFNFRAKS